MTRRWKLMKTTTSLDTFVRSLKLIQTLLSMETWTVTRRVGGKNATALNALGRTGKKRAPVSYVVGPDGRHGAGGKEFWFIPGKFAFCLCCQEEPNQGMRERSKLAGLSGEGRSSATTLLISSALEWMNHSESGVPETKRKLLGFTDNRQDAALQSGNFNDFLFVSLLRGAILRAIIAAGNEGLTEDEFGLKVVKALGFTSANKDARAHWMLDPSSGAVIREDAQRALAKVLAHRVWTDLRRGWRYTNPSLFVLNLLDVEFVWPQGHCFGPRASDDCAA